MSNTQQSKMLHFSLNNWMSYKSSSQFIFSQTPRLYSGENLLFEFSVRPERNKRSMTSFLSVFSQPLKHKQTQILRRQLSTRYMEITQAHKYGKYVLIWIGSRFSIWIDTPHARAKRRRIRVLRRSVFISLCQLWFKLSIHTTPTEKLYT